LLLCACFLTPYVQVWECRSRTARSLIAHKCLTAFRVGLLQYLSLLWLCLMALLGFSFGAKAAVIRWAGVGLKLLAWLRVALLRTPAAFLTEVLPGGGATCA
jgi:hypothetical protein